MPDVEELSHAFLTAHPVEAARVLEHLAPEACAQLFAEEPARVLAPAVRAMLPFMAAQALVRLSAEDAARLLTECGAGSGAAIMRYVPESRRTALIEALPTATAVSLRLLLGFPANSVGAWIDTALPALPGNATAEAALERLRAGTDDEVEVVHVIDATQRLLGLVDLGVLLRAGGNVLLSSLMSEPRHLLPVNASLASVRNHAGWDERLTLPAVERDGRLVGVLHRAALMQALAHATPRDAAAPGAPREQTTVLGALGDAYWTAADGLMQAVIAMLPGAPPVKRSPARHG